MSKRGDGFLPAARSWLRIGLYPPSHWPHRTVNAGIMKNAMTPIHPAAKALQNLLRSDVFFAASWVGQSIEEILGYLINMISYFFTFTLRILGFTHQAHCLHIVDEYLDDINGLHWLTVESRTLHGVV